MIINNINITNNFTEIKMFCNYPKGEIIQTILTDATTRDLADINTFDKLDAYMTYIQTEYQEGILSDNLTNADLETKSYTWALLAAIVHNRMINSSMQDRISEVEEIIEASEGFHDECTKELKLLGRI